MQPDQGLTSSGGSHGPGICKAWELLFDVVDPLCASLARITQFLLYAVKTPIDGNSESISL